MFLTSQKYNFFNKLKTGDIFLTEDKKLRGQRPSKSGVSFKLQFIIWNKNCTFVYKQKNFIMSTLELKQELHTLINEADDNFIKKFYEMAKTYAIQLENEKMIEEAEDDIREGRLYSQEEAEKIIANWKP